MILTQGASVLAAPAKADLRPAAIGLAGNRAALGLIAARAAADGSCTPKNDGSNGCQGNDAGGKPNTGLPPVALIAVVLGGGAIAAAAGGGGGGNGGGNPGSP
ncbi:MAG: hypothetical protein KGL44_02410 [Sphingomonadales bacterium]|nr:hypothetical protein [Sphingomonadales bacterium]